MPNEIGEELNKALKSNFSGQTEVVTVQRDGFTLTSSFYSDGRVEVVDQWVDGGGQELIRSGDQVFTRVYAGRAAKQENLDQLGIN